MSECPHCYECVTTLSIHCMCVCTPLLLIYAPEVLWPIQRRVRTDNDAYEILITSFTCFTYALLATSFVVSSLE